MIVNSIRKLAPLIGMSHVMLGRHLAKGKFKVEPRGGYDVEKVRSALTRHSDISQPSQAGRKRQNGAAPEIPISELGSDISSYDAFNRARAAKEIAIAKEKRLNLREREGELLEAEDVKLTWTNGLTRFANILLLAPDKLAPKVAALTDVLEIRALIDKEIRAALRALSESEADAA